MLEDVTSWSVDDTSALPNADRYNLQCGSTSYDKKAGAQINNQHEWVDQVMHKKSMNMLQMMNV